MKQIRRGVFETNSSSTHSICIQKKPATPRSIHFTFGEYGWEQRTVYDTASYLYTLIMNRDDAKEKLARLKEILDAHNIEYTFANPGQYDDDYFGCGYVDHSYAAGNFVEAVLNDEDLLFRYLFGFDSCIYTGNDNSSADDAMCWAAFEYDEHYIGGEWVKTPNPNHESDKYDYFFKGN
jgi:hypothetical protein